MHMGWHGLLSFSIQPQLISNVLLFVITNVHCRLLWLCANNIFWVNFRWLRYNFGLIVYLQHTDNDFGELL